MTTSRVRFSLVACALMLGACAAQAQVAEQIPRQSAGATDWFGEQPIRIGGGERVDVTPRVDCFLALVRMLPDGRLELVHAGAAPAHRQGFDVPRPAGSGVVRVPFTITQVSPGRSPMPLPTEGPHRTPPPPHAAPDGVLVVLSDVGLDSALLAARLEHLPPMPRDSVANLVGYVLVGRQTPMWAAYYQPR